MPIPAERNHVEIVAVEKEHAAHLGQHGLGKNTVMG
jgi:hypothetical protein